MSKFSVCMIALAGLAGCASNQSPVKTTATAPAPTLSSGIDLQYVDSSVRPQDDAYQYLNGKWLRTFQLPRDRGAVGSFTAIEDTTEEQLRTIVEGHAGAAPGAAAPGAAAPSAAAPGTPVGGG